MDSSDWQINKLKQIKQIKQINITGYDYSYSQVLFISF